MATTVEDLKAFQPKHDFFIGIDSDGCAFDTMEIKHKECFIPNTIKYWNLQAVSKYAREAAEFVNLYSVSRGINRFPALIRTLDLLTERREVKRRNVEVPRAQAIRDWMDRETKLGNPKLKQEVADTGDPGLAEALAWSEAVNETIADMVHGIPPFPGVTEFLQEASDKADLVVVSQTPIEALSREWDECGNDKYLEFICGQEQGTKTEHIAMTAGGKYAGSRMLMIGDAPGDRKAGDANGTLFYPVCPGEEEESWDRFVSEALGRFFDGTYEGEYQDELIRDFERRLPDTPPWT